MDRVVDTVGNWCRLSVLEDLNGWVGDIMREGITSTFGVPRVNDNGRRVVVFWAENVFCG